MENSHCKYCGSLSFQTLPGKGPHAFEQKCGDCGKHHKWLSKIDTEELSDGELEDSIFQTEWDAIHAAQEGKFADFMAYTNKLDRYLGKAYERI